MKPILRKTLFLCTAVLLSQTVFAQTRNKSFKNSIPIEQLKNKDIIQFLYDSIFNPKQFDKLPTVISSDYTNPAGGKGVDGFQKSLLDLSKAFPDAEWKIKELIADGNKVVVQQVFTGTHKNPFQNIPATNKAVSVEGIATYEFQNGKITGSQIQTDRLGFLQQLGVLPEDLSGSKKETIKAIHFIDKFFVPKTSIAEFKKQMTYNRAFIKTLPGYVSGQAFEQYDNDGNLTILTIAAWENEDKLNAAKIAVQEEFKRTGFNPAEFNQRLNVKMERGQYVTGKE